MEDNINTELAKGVAQEAVKEIKEERSFAMELLADYKLITKRLYHIIIGLGIVLVATIAGFLIYLNQYDYTSTYEYSATGVNAIIDNSGNVIAQDIPDNQLKQILEILNNGNGENEDKENQN